MMNTRVKNILVYLLIGALGILIGKWWFGGAASHEHIYAEEQEVIYTCSMHPQIRQNEKGKCPLCGMDLTPATGAFTGERNPYVLQMSEEAVALANIQTQRVKAQQTAASWTLNGNVRINEERRVAATAKFPGRIEQLYVNFEGQQVRKGDKLATIFSAELIAAQHELQEAALMKESRPELYTAAVDKLRQWRLSEAQIASIAAAAEPMRRFDIYSDVSGVVTQLAVSEGDYLSTGSLMAELVDLSTVWVVLDAYESQLADLRVGKKMHFSAQAFPNQTFEGAISYINPTLDAQSRSLAVRATVANPGGLLKPGMFVQGSIQGEANAMKISIPQTAVLWTGKRSLVYVKVPDTEHPQFEMRDVVLGAKVGEQYLITSGLDEGEEVVVNGVFAVDGAAQLNGNYSMMVNQATKNIEVDDSFLQDFDGLLQLYFELKNALAADDASTAQQNAAGLASLIVKLQSSTLQDEALMLWQEIQPKLRTNAEKIAQQKAIDLQRDLFIHLSDKMIEVVERMGFARDVVYKSYCPMADNDEGAYWLSEVKEIRNPYFGASMLKCGEVKRTYRKGQRVFENE
jgi:membrane fusion protein, copper/silver efflux system